MDFATHEPLGGVEFKIATSAGTVVGNGNGIFVTDNQGLIKIPNLPKGSYIVTETKTLPTHILETQAQAIAVDYGQTCTLDVYNKQKSGIQIIKIDSITKQPLKGAQFTVYKNDEIVGVFETDGNGLIILDELEPAWYKIVESRAPANHATDSTPQTVQVGTDGKTHKVIFEDYPYGNIVIRKMDFATHEPLSGVEFKITTSTGTVVGNSNGIFVTDNQGLIKITNLPKGSYIVAETTTLSTHILESQAQTIAVDYGQTYALDVYNKQKSGMQIIKIDSITKQPLKGAQFTVYKMNGEIAGTYETDGNGIIILDKLEPSWYKIVESKAPTGYKSDDLPKDVQITDNQFVRVVFENVPQANLQILKVDSETRLPIPNVEFAVSKMNGERIGVYTTDSHGAILITGVNSGWYTCEETKAGKGYLLDSTPHNIEVKDGKVNSITITNRKASAILIHKIDSVTSKGIYGVKFLLSDSNSNPLMTLESDQDGYVYLPNIPDGKYLLRELEVKGYILDTQVKTFYVQYGATTEITWKNTPMMGQLQIIKKSADDNAINGFPKGTLLEGAVFEVYDRVNNLVDTITSNKNGLAVSKTLPLGRYTVREVKAPIYYSALQEPVSFEIEFSGQLIKLEILDSSVYTSVSITKRGYAEVVSGQQIKYDFKNIGNNSTVSLDSFYWRDTLPTDAARLNKIITGTYSHQLNYKIVYKTNTNSGYRTLSDNLSTGKVYTINASSAALGLASNEFVTEFMVVFGRVPAGFKQIEAPYIYCDVLKSLQHEYRFTNKCDVGGLWGSQWIMATDRWVTVVYSKSAPPSLPRTGY
jgi:uncharacterized surface anchored protein